MSDKVGHQERRNKNVAIPGLLLRGLSKIEVSEGLLDSHSKHQALRTIGVVHKNTYGCGQTKRLRTPTAIECFAAKLQELSLFPKPFIEFFLVADHVTEGIGPVRDDRTPRSARAAAETWAADKRNVCDRFRTQHVAS